MNAKHYVSLEAAKKLKEINHDGLNYTMHIGNDEIIYPAYVVGDVYPAPTLLEAMDWLEERGIYIEIRMLQLKVSTTSYKDKYKYEYYFVIYSDDTDSFPISEHRDGSFYLTYPDRYECMNAAIKKGVELL